MHPGVDPANQKQPQDQPQGQPFFLWSKIEGVITSMVQEEVKDIYEDNDIYAH